MNNRRTRVAVVFLFLTVGITGAASADPVTVTSGFFRLNANDGPAFDFRGDGFRLSGFSLTVPSGIFPFEDCLSCSAGTSIRLGTNVQGQALEGLGEFVTFAGQSYDSIDRLFYAGELKFDSSDVVVPGTGEPFLELVQPFAFTGRLMAFPSPDRIGNPLFTADLRGRGLARFLLVEGEPGDYNFADLTYRFDDNTPVPEPATMTLIGSGLAGLLIRARRRKA